MEGGFQTDEERSPGFCRKGGFWIELSYRYDAKTGKKVEAAEAYAGKGWVHTGAHLSHTVSVSIGP